MAVMRRRKWAGIAGLLVAALMGAAGPKSARADIVIDNLLTEDYANDKSKDKGKIVLFVDVFDGQGKFVTGLEKDPSIFKVFIDEKEVEGTIEVQTFKDANQRFAVAILAGAHYSYSEYDPASGMPNILEAEKTGFENFVKKLSTSNMIGVWFHTDDALNRVFSWSNKPDAAGDAIRDLIKKGEKKQGVAPKLYAWIKTILDDIANNEASLPPRRVLLVMSDGKDQNVDKPAQLEKSLKAIEDAATTTRTKIYPIGFTIDVPEPLVHLGTIASQSKGAYRRIPEDKAGDIAAEIEGIANELQNQYVVTLTPKDYRGSEAPVTVRLEVTPPGLTAMKDQKEQIKIPKLSTDHWNVWIKWVVIGLGSLLGVGLIFMLIRAIARGRKNRPVAVAEEEAFAGPYKGKLTCTMGPYAGKEFFLTEDLTTIGSISGNTIILAEGGVSKRHAGIKIEEMRFELADFGSTNGTFVNGAKITKQFLRDGDEVRMGEVRLKFSLK